MVLSDGVRPLVSALATEALNIHKLRGEGLEGDGDVTAGLKAAEEDTITPSMKQTDARGGTAEVTRQIFLCIIGSGW